MSKYRFIAVLALTTLVVPSLAQASWWNPFSWGNSDTKRQEVTQTISTTTKTVTETPTATSSKKTTTVTKPKPDTVSIKKVASPSSQSVVCPAGYVCTPKQDALSDENQSLVRQFLEAEQQKQELLRQYQMQQQQIQDEYQQQRNELQNALREQQAQAQRCNDYINQVNQVDSQVRASISAGGGFATESQVQGLIRNKIRSIPVPYGCYY